MMDDDNEDHDDHDNDERDDDDWCQSRYLSEPCGRMVITQEEQEEQLLGNKTKSFSKGTMTNVQAGRLLTTTTSQPNPEQQKPTSFAVVDCKNNTDKLSPSPNQSPKHKHFHM
jgi:hypothetical protein